MTAQINAWEHRLLDQAYEPLENRFKHDIRLIVDQIHLQQAYLHCQAITRKHSHTFYMASALLPRAERLAIRALYAFCRVSDDLVDEGQGNRLEALNEWRRRTMDTQPPTGDPVALAWAETRSRFDIPIEYAEQLLAGVSRDLTQNRYETFAELADYCYAVASTVGLMSMHIVGYSGKEAIPYAVKLGVALQVTNILRDINEDWENGRLYLPLDELASFNLAEADIAAGLVDDRWRAFMEFQIQRARRLFAEALPGIAMLGKSGRFAIGAAAELYQGILDEIEANDYDVFSQRAHVSDWNKLVRLPGIWWRARLGNYQTQIAA